MFGKELPRYTGNVAWRGLVPAERVAHLDVAKVTGVWMGPNRSIVQYYVAAGRTFNWIGISRSRAAGARVLARRRARRGCARRIFRLARHHPHHHRGDAEAAAPGALRPRAAAGLAGRPRRAAGRCRPSDDAVLCAGRRAEHRGRLCARRLSRGERRTSRSPRWSATCKLRQPRTAWMQGLARREEELYQMNDAATIAERNARMRTNRIPESANFPPEQERLYGYDAEAVLHVAAGGTITMRARQPVEARSCGSPKALEVGYRIAPRGAYRAEAFVGGRRPRRANDDRHAQTARRQGCRRRRALGAGRRQVAGDRRPRLQARDRPAGADRPDARSLRRSRASRSTSRRSWC